jgi:tetratricopeptide (TPR) repeat protein
MVAVVAAAVASGIAAVAVLTRDERAASTQPQRRGGAPPLLLDLGVRRDPEARALRRAIDLYFDRRRPAAGRVFLRYRSVDAQVGAAISAWPRGSLDRLEDLARAYPRSAVVRLHLGLALFWEGRTPAAVSAWRAAVRVEPDSQSAIRADDFLHPNFPRGLPQFVPSFELPRSLARLPADRQLAALARRAGNNRRARLLYGAALQRLGRTLSAQRQFAAAVRLAPGDPEPRVALAVARFTKANPERTFSQLGPLSRRHPRSATVRFHLGVSLLWLGQVREGRRQLRLASAAGRSTLLGRQARRFLRGLNRATGAA